MGVGSSLLLFTAICGLWAAISAVLIAVELGRRGVRTPFPFVGLLVFRNLRLYREATLSETGKIGPLFFSYVVPINAALVSILVYAALAG